MVGRTLRLELLAPARIRWSSADWSSFADSETRATALGMFVCDLPTEKLRAGSVVRFTFFWTQGNAWEGTDFEVAVDNGVS